ncbi:hypothetical protein HTZ77_33940 [Nonomuraea sp. SMC257]|uniref:Prenyltransferase n=1 Tax=Nonomuraea montanisoli TaxID=2741721 RepID=A0A7Y6IDQ3_9ACTN|nr:aromatic prenyltransferase [Nonomuraea montanisoli]NUW36375.1 hypothetical protein [Nonomuraea montanisoli]
MGQTVSFSESLFLDEIKRTAAALGARYEEDLTRKVLDTFGDGFRDGATVWKTTGRPGDHLCYRFFARAQNDTVATALKAGLLAEESAATRLIRDWTEAQGGAATQSCDFDAANGLAKTWLYLGGMRPAEEILGRSFVPAGLRGQLDAFHAAQLDYLRFVAVDHRHQTVNLYFRTRGPITMDRCAEILRLVDAAPPDEAQLADIRTFVPEDFCVAVTASMATGAPERCCFYALKLPPGRFPAIPERIAQFFAEAPSYDDTTVNAVGWSFGRRGGTYIKAEKGYLGDMSALLTDWDCYFSGSTQKDPVLG